MVTLSGTGLAPTVTISPASLTFASQPVGVVSAAQTVTVTNTSVVGVTLGTVGLTGANAGEFLESTTCGTALAAGASCAVTVRFQASGGGSAVASLNVTDSGAGSPQMVGLTGAATAVLNLTKVSTTEWDITNGVLNFALDPTKFNVSNLKVTLNGVTTNFLDPTTGESPFGHAIGLYNL